MAYICDLRLKGYVGGWDFDSDYVEFILAKKSDKPVTVVIDSTGGSAATALSVAALFKQHGNVHVHFVGYNASAATVAALGAKSVSIDKSAMYLIHNARCWVGADECSAADIDALTPALVKTKEYLDKLDHNIASYYAHKCGKDIDKIKELMSQDKWLSAAEAKEWGFVDSVTDYDEDPAPVMSAALATALTENSIPVPESSATFVDRLLAGLKSFFNGTHSINSYTMPKADSAKSQDATLQQMDIEALRCENAQLKARIAELEIEPAVTKETQVHNTAAGPQTENALSSFIKTTAAANKLFKNLP